jgi:hypothetical protein
MYPSVKDCAIDEAKAIEICGADVVERVKGLSCDFTGRVIDECYEVTEFSASTKFVDEDGVTRTLEILYLVDNDDLEAAEDDLGRCDWSNYTFEVV